MNKIITPEQLETLSKQLKSSREKIILAGGCFDVLHIGHIEFLEKAKELGGKLVILLESDPAIKRAKGENRPIHSQMERAKVLSRLDMVDQIVLLPDQPDYNQIITTIAPSIIAITAGDPLKNQKLKQAQMVGGKVIEVTERLTDRSSTSILKNLGF